MRPIRPLHPPREGLAFRCLTVARQGCPSLAARWAAFPAVAEEVEAVVLAPAPALVAEAAVTTAMAAVMVVVTAIMVMVRLRFMVGDVRRATPVGRRGAVSPRGHMAAAAP